MKKTELARAKKVTAEVGGRIIWHSDDVFPQHFFPLSIVDYCEAIKKEIREGIEQMPILSVSSKDYPYCDFDCVDCLACPSREWAVNQGGIKQPIIPIKTYKKILREIARYSAERGCKSVRFELCGEGNPDLYSDRAEMVRFAVEECNMGIVYVSTGSQMSDELANVLAKYAACIRISFPGVNQTAYRYYSGQRKNCFSFEDAMQLVKKLCDLRAQYGRQEELLIGTRTCIRPFNDGSYEEFLKRLGSYGVDAFQGVKVLTPEFTKHRDEIISVAAIEELSSLKKQSKKFGIESFQIPSNLKAQYNNRRLLEKPSMCWSSLISPPLYGTSLMSCVLWEKITDPRYHYGIMSGQAGELDELMKGENAEFIRKNCPCNCEDCPAINDNRMMDSLYNRLKNVKNLESVEFHLE